MLIDEIRVRMKAAMKAHKTVEKEILRVALGEITTEEARRPEGLSDQEVEKILRKLVKSNRETLDSVPDPDQRAMIEEEIAVLDSLLPKTLTVEEIVAELAGVEGEIKAANNDGQATGAAMKHLKPKGLVVTGKDVSAAVKRIRG